MQKFLLFTLLLISLQKPIMSSASTNEVFTSSESRQNVGRRSLSKITKIVFTIAAFVACFWVGKVIIKEYGDNKSNEEEDPPTEQEKDSKDDEKEKPLGKNNKDNLK
ncbi:MAG: hypothetical protein AAF335_02460, partial [Bacteroidota bacterium]